MKKSVSKKVELKDLVIEKIKDEGKPYIAAESFQWYEDCILFVSHSRVKFNPMNFILINQNGDEIKTLPYKDYDVYLDKTEYGMDLKFFEKGNCQMIESMRVFNF
jgi:hypothetical protein